MPDCSSAQKCKTLTMTSCSVSRPQVAHIVPNAGIAQPTSYIPPKTAFVGDPNDSGLPPPPPINSKSRIQRQKANFFYGVSNESKNLSCNSSLESTAHRLKQINYCKFATQCLLGDPRIAVKLTQRYSTLYQRFSTLFYFETLDFWGSISHCSGRDEWRIEMWQSLCWCVRQRIK